jgi:SAM-dependent methyltransferase
MLVLDLGSGAFPNPRADLLCDRDLVDNRHRAGLPVVVDRPLVRADATALPFRDKSVDFVIASHLAEHVTEPEAFCAELARVARAGYIETPSPLADYLLDEEYHIWRVGRHGDRIRFRAKGPRSKLRAALTDRFYMVFYAAQPSCERPTYTLPEGPLGQVAAFALRAFGGVLNRLGLMHTRYLFTPKRPLRCEVDRVG